MRLLQKCRHDVCILCGIEVHIARATMLSCFCTWREMVMDLVSINSAFERYANLLASLE